MNPFEFETAPRIVCAQGSAARLGDIARGLGMRHAFVVTDRFLFDTGALQGAMAGLNAAGVKLTVFCDVQADPPEASVDAAAQSARLAGADGVIGFGGGSSMDTAKLVALLARTAQALPGIYGVGLARGPRLPLVQVPTTAGTGSEVTPISIVTTPSAEKKGVVSAVLYPDVAVLDSRLTLGLPPRLTAMTGIDAMVHAIEAYTSRIKKNPVSDALALRALVLLHANLRTVLADPGDADAREAMLLGSLLAGMAFANAPVGAVHALAYPLGGHFHVPHGLSNALVLKPVLAFNRIAARDAYAELAHALGAAPAGGSADSAAAGFVAAISALVDEMPFERNLRAVGVDESHIMRLADDAMKVQRLLVNNPREVSHGDAMELYRAAY